MTGPRLFFEFTSVGEVHGDTHFPILEFPDSGAAKAFASDPDYARFASARQAGSNSRFQLIDDTDVAGTIPYLGKG